MGRRFPSAEGVDVSVVVPVHNGEHVIGQTMERLLDVVGRMSELTVEIVVCDDGSIDGTYSELEQIEEGIVRVVRHPENRGRSSARNSAAAASNGRYLYFLDADCFPLNNDLFRVIGRNIAGDVDLAYGPVKGLAEGFWEYYLKDVERERSNNAVAGKHLLAITSANLLVKRDIFQSVGGYLEDYRYYGFEDKDLVARLLNWGVLPQFDDQLTVAHQAGNTVTNYCLKMREAARFSAPIFAGRFPECYREMSFGKLDEFAQKLPDPVLGLVCQYGSLAAIKMGSFGEQCRFVPDSVTRIMVKLAAVFSYLQGMAERDCYDH